MILRTYQELRSLNTFEERFDYCKTPEIVGEQTFGSLRYFNQKFYTSEVWRKIRREVILRDKGCDLSMQDGNHEIIGKIIIHHLMPITIEDINNQTDRLLDPNYMVCVSELTHKAIHYSDSSILPKDFVERRPNDTIPWR